MSTHDPLSSVNAPHKGRIPRRRAAQEGKVRKEFWLNPVLLAETQAVLGTATERETVEVALDLVAVRGELVGGTTVARSRLGSHG